MAGFEHGTSQLQDTMHRPLTHHIIYLICVYKFCKNVKFAKLKLHENFPVYGISFMYTPRQKNEASMIRALIFFVISPLFQHIDLQNNILLYFLFE